MKDKTGLYVNMFVGSRVHVGEVAGTPLEVVQETDYPWHGKVMLTLNPEQARSFTLRVRVPNRHTSSLYTETPALEGFKSLRVNGEAVKPHIERGYAVITREWRAGDRVEFELPMEPQRVVADDRIKADLGSVALKYGPLVYNVETADQADMEQGLSDQPLTTEWRPDLLGGVMVIKGTWKNGAPMMAIPNHARMNRVGAPAEYLGDPEINYAPGATTGSGKKTPAQVGDSAAPRTAVIVKPRAGAGITALPGANPEGHTTRVDSKVWI